MMHIDGKNSKYLKSIILIENKENKSTEIEEWLIWAKSKLDWYNPTINADDELLNNVDKDDLHFKINL
jgi:hypothetical protein